MDTSQPRLYAVFQSFSEQSFGGDVWYGTVLMATDISVEP